MFGELTTDRNSYSIIPATKAIALPLRHLNSTLSTAVHQLQRDNSF